MLAVLLILTVGAAATFYLWREPQVTVISSRAGVATGYARVDACGQWYRLCEE